MSIAYDLTAPVSLPEFVEETVPANGPGPMTAPQPPPTLCRQTGAEACVPPVTSRNAPAPRSDCTGVGACGIDEQSGPSMPDGKPYPGNLLADILEYRRMRTRVLGGANLPETEGTRYEELQSLLRASESRDQGHARAYHRYDIRVPATLRVSEGRVLRSLRIGVDNISAGGVKLQGASARVAGERVELMMDAGDGRVVVLPARVAWIAGNELGLMFAGAARWR